MQVQIRHGSVLLTGTQNTNVVKLFALLRKDEPHRQLVYYQVGSAALVVIRR